MLTERLSLALIQIMTPCHTTAIPYLATLTLGSKTCIPVGTLSTPLVVSLLHILLLLQLALALSMVNNSLLLLILPRRRSK